MPAVTLRFSNYPLRTFVVSGAISVGRGADCDIVVHDEEIGDHELTIRLEGEEVWVKEVGDDGRERRLRMGHPFFVGRRHTLVLSETVPARLEPTQPTGPKAGVLPSCVLVWQGSGTTHRLPLRRVPLIVGSRPDSDLCLSDPTVSGRHCRLSLCGEGLSVRDLGSRNGTWVDGLRVRDAVCQPGVRLRIGCTELTVASADEGKSARLVAKSHLMLALLAEVDRCAQVPFAALILGESGSGKEGIAHELHLRGPRRDGPFVAVNGSGLSGTLLESELFGHDKGAFTGAVEQHRGVFEQADGGTLFLDEVGELPASTQAKLLRVLDTGRIRRVGSEGTLDVSVRVVAATHRDLMQDARSGRFRADLYYRLAQCLLEVPPLRDCKGDIAPLCRHFLAAYRTDLGHRELGPGALKRLKAHSFPGNVRELRNVISTASLLSAGPILTKDAIAKAISRVSPQAPRRARMDLVLAEHDGNISAAARALGLPRTTLRDRLKGSRLRGLHSARSLDGDPGENERMSDCERECEVACEANRDAGPQLSDRSCGLDE